MNALTVRRDTEPHPCTNLSEPPHEGRWLVDSPGELSDAYCDAHLLLFLENWVTFAVAMGE